MLDHVLQKKLEALERRGLSRSLRLVSGAQTTTVALEGNAVLQLSSNNYLDLANHPAVKQAATSPARSPDK